MECERELERKLEASKLPQASRAVIEEAFSDRVFESSELDKVIKRAKDALSDEDESGRVTESGRTTRVSAAFSPEDKREVAFLRWLGGSAGLRRIEQQQEDELVRGRVTEAYRAWQKQGKPAPDRIYRVSEFVRDMYGFNPFLEPQRMSEANATTSSLTTVVKNTVNLLVAADYSIRERWWEPLVTTHEVDTIDDATLARFFGVNALRRVNEGAAYLEMEIKDEEETASFVKKGDYLGITMETMMQDKVDFLRSLPRRLSNAWYNTLSDMVSAVFTTNSNTGPQLADTGALFNNAATSSTGGHANLGGTALSYTTWDAAVTAMMKQTDQPSGNGRRLGMENQPKFLLVPVDLRSTGLQIRNSEYLPSSQNNDVNPYYQGFDVIPVPTWTDTDNWAAVADPDLMPAIHLIFPRGNTTPAIFTAGDDTSGAMFTNDELRYKIQMLTYEFSSTYTCAPVSDFRPLYKANV
jgi:hypothetical protein